MSDPAGLAIAATVTVWGEPIAYRPDQGHSPALTGITGIFDNAYVSLMPTDDIGLSGNVNTVRPNLGVSLAQFGAYAPQKGDLAMIRGTWYVVRDVQLDGHGGANLPLNVAEARILSTQLA